MLAWLATDGFRNLATQRVELNSDLVVVYGANAQGKSSFLEAAYLLATTRSFRTRDPRETIRHGGERSFVRGAVDEGSGAIELAVARGRGRGDRALSVGEYEVELAEYLEHLPALVTTGESIRSVAGSPSERRRYVDRATAAAQPGHLPDLAELRRLLSQRNQLLRQEASDAELDPWDELLARVGERIVRRRLEQIEAWQGGLGDWASLFPEGADLKLVYRRAGAGKDEALTAREALARARRTDRRLGVTSVGPHRDDLVLEVGGRDLWRFGSAGQIRSALEALTLAQARRVRELRADRTPLLILDDVDSDLDPGRFQGLLAAARVEAQVLAATSKPEMVRGVASRRLRVEDGVIHENESQDD